MTIKITALPQKLDDCQPASTSQSAKRFRNRYLTVKLFILSILLPLSLFAKSIPITLELAQTDRERTWGLMQRDWLPENHGMLFIYETPKTLSVWMFNCFMDLSVAFIDSKGIIKEIKELKAYPEMMDPARPVLSYSDLKLYPPYDPVIRFFRSRSVISSQQVRYILEMQGGWFAENGVQPGDRLIWKYGSNEAVIQTTD